MLFVEDGRGGGRGGGGGGNGGAVGGSGGGGGGGGGGGVGLLDPLIVVFVFVLDKVLVGGLREGLLAANIRSARVP